jgi:hypothetical protein
VKGVSELGETVRQSRCHAVMILPAARPVQQNRRARSMPDGWNALKCWQKYDENMTAVPAFSNQEHVFPC